MKNDYVAIVCTVCHYKTYFLNCCSVRKTVFFFLCYYVSSVTVAFSTLKIGQRTDSIQGKRSTKAGWRVVVVDAEVYFVCPTLLSGELLCSVAYMWFYVFQ